MLKLNVALLSTAAIAALASSSHGFVINGDFETGDLTGWSRFAVPPGEPLPLLEVQSFDTNGDGFSSPAAAFQAGGFPGGGAISQELDLDVGSYWLSADVAVRSYSNNQDGGTFELLFDGAVVDLFASGVVRVGSTTRHSLEAGPLVVTAGTHEVQLRVTRWFAASSSTPKQFIDNVLLEIPEPGIFSMLAVCLLTLSANRRFAGHRPTSHRGRRASTHYKVPESIVNTARG